MTDKDSLHKNLKIFSLIRLRSQCRIAPIRVDFCTPHLPTATPTSIIPSFNPDRSSCTPSFILPIDKKYYQENLAFQKYQFEEKIQRSVQGTNFLQFSPLPEELKINPPNSNYCQICQQKFQDYFTHIQLKIHRIRETNSEGTQLIQLLCSTFSRKAKVQVAKSKTKAVRKAPKRQEKCLSKKILNKIKKSDVNVALGSVKGQNFSTCLIQESSIQFEQ